MCSAVAVVALVPSAKFHAYEAMVPSESDEALPSNWQSSFVQLYVNAAVGSWFTVNVWLVAPVAPLLSVTTSTTVYSSTVAYTWLGVAPVAVVPSPKSHAYAAMLPSGSLEVD